MTNKIEYIDIRMLTPHPDNPRKDVGDVTELADSIKRSGVLQNLTVVPVLNGDGFVEEYRVVIGHRRLAAAKLAGLTTVPCSITEMDYKTQLATMLSENMQLVDLTLVEQVDGIQMMLDLGESVETVSEVTGLSESTVRRRAKLAELPREEFAAAVERGGRLEDYAKIDELTDPKHRKTALEAIGTAEFSGKIERLRGEERWNVRKAEIIGILDGWGATKVTKCPDGYEYEHDYGRWSDSLPPTEAPDSTRKYCYAIADSYISVYAEAQTTITPEMAERAARDAELMRRRDALDVLTKQAYERRRDFVLGMSEAAASKHTERLIGACAVALLENGFMRVDSSLEEYIGIDDNTENKLVAVAMVEPSRLLLMTWYALTADDEDEGYYEWYCVRHKSNPRLDRVYDTLIAMGYEPTADEIALRVGSHELFRDEEDVGGESDSEESE